MQIVSLLIISRVLFILFVVVRKKRSCGDRKGIVVFFEKVVSLIFFLFFIEVVNYICKNFFVR